MRAHPWLDSVSDAASRSKPSLPASQTTKRESWALPQDGAQRAALSTSASASAPTGSGAQARGE